MDVVDKGETLPVSEIVPFRLTANIIDALGTYKENGIFQKSSQVVMQVLRNNKTNIMSFLASFKHELFNETSNSKKTIDDELKIIEDKLTG